MNLEFLNRRRAERFAELLDETTGGRRHHSRGQGDEQLAELVAIGHRLSATRTRVQVEPEFRVGLRAMLVATAERDGIGATALAVETEPGAHAGIRESGRGVFRLSGSGRRIRARGSGRYSRFLTLAKRDPGVGMDHGNLCLGAGRSRHLVQRHSERKPR